MGGTDEEEVADPVREDIRRRLIIVRESNRHDRGGDGESDEGAEDFAVNRVLGWIVKQEEPYDRK